ncbi:MAG: hypothetical protein ACRENS_04980, partial [Candidatus Eiseniibacteriota bacterium]
MNAPVFISRRRGLAGRLPALALAALFGIGIMMGAPAAALAKLLIPMDEHQSDHLRAYGLTYW